MIIFLRAPCFIFMLLLSDVAKVVFFVHSVVGAEKFVRCSVFRGIYVVCVTVCGYITDIHI